MNSPPSAAAISVIIPAYNRAPVLGRALDSVLAQGAPPGEVIVADDGSSDATAELVRRRYPDCRYLRQPNRGVSAARNLGLRAARGDWIALLDSDDAWLPGKLAAQIAQLRREPELRVCHTEEIWIRNGTRVNAMKKHAKQGGWIYRHCLPLCVISPSSVLLHRSVFETAGEFDETLPACEDYDLWLRICARMPVAFVAEPQIIKHGGHPDQLSRQHWGMDRFRVRALARALSELPLDAEDRQATAATLVQKAQILAQGADKRGKTQQAADYRALAARYRVDLL